METIKKKAGKISPSLMGDYDNTTEYRRLDWVYYGGISYMCKKNGTLGISPTNTERWQKIVDPTDVDMIFDEAKTRDNIMSGEKLSVILGKIKKTITDLKEVAFTGDYEDLTSKPIIPQEASDIGAAREDLVGVQYDPTTKQVDVEYAYPDLKSGEVLVNYGAESLSKALTASSMEMSNKVINVYEESVHKPSILNTSEQISANTSSENIAGALALKEISNNLNNKINQTNSEIIKIKTYTVTTGIDGTVYISPTGDNASKILFVTCNTKTYYIGKIFKNRYNMWYARIYDDTNAPVTEAITIEINVGYIL